MSFDVDKLSPVIDKYRGRRGVLLELLQAVQEEFGYIPEESMEPMANAMNMPPSRIFGTITFYSELRTQPPPKVQVEMCLGPTCHLQGAEHIRDILKARLGLNAEWRTGDNSVGIHIIQCAGHCHLAPLLYVNGEVIANLRVQDAAAFTDGLMANHPNESQVANT